MLKIRVVEKDRALRIQCDTVEELEKLTEAIWVITQPSIYPESMRIRYRSDALELLQKADLEIAGEEEPEKEVQNA